MLNDKYRNEYTPLNGERIATKFKQHSKTAQIEVVKLIERQGRANLGVGNCRLIRNQSGRGRCLDHGKRSQLNGNSAGVAHWYRVHGVSVKCLSSRGIRRNDSSLPRSDKKQERCLSKNPVHIKMPLEQNIICQT
jgi:hypothetical protein